MDKILFFTTRQLCYNSAHFFADRLIHEFEKMGYECEVCEIPEEAIPGVRTEFARPISESAGKAIEVDAEKLLEKYIGKKYQAIIDFNSKLPRLVLDDDSYYLDNIEGEFYNFILDHPLYHHSTLDCKLKNYNVISVDGDHCEYIKKYYPHIKSVHHIMLGAEEANSIFEGKESKLLFMGTYRNPDKYLDYIKNGNSIAAQDMLLMIDMMKENFQMTIESAYKASIVINDRPEVMLPMEQMNLIFALNMNSYYLVEAYIRNYHRKCMLDKLVNEGFPVRVVGDWWEEYPLRDKVEIGMPVAFADSYDEISRCKVLVDSAPFFTNGIHDRVFAGMANKTAVLTNNNEYKSKILQGNNIFSVYEDEKDICEKAAFTMENAEEITEKAFEYYTNNCTWECVAKRIVCYCV